MILQALACPIVDQGEVWDRVLERKTALVLKVTLKEENLDAIELPRVVKDAAGNPANEWEAIYQLPDVATGITGNLLQAINFTFL